MKEQRLRLLSTLEHPDRVRDVCFSADGGRVASAGMVSAGARQAEVRVWETETGRGLLCLELECDDVGRVAFNQGGQGLAATSVIQHTGINPGRVTVWSKGQSLWFNRGLWGAGPLAYDREGRRLAVGSNSNYCGMRDGQGQPMGHGAVLVLESGDLSCQLNIGADRGPVVDVAFSADGKRVTAATRGSVGLQSDVRPGGLTMWEVDSGCERSMVTVKPECMVTAMAVQSGEQLVAVARCPWWWVKDRNVPCEIGFYDPTDWAERLVLRGLAGRINRIAFSPDGLRLASASDDGHVAIWDVSSGRALAMVEAHEGAAAAVQFGPGGQHLVTGGGEGTVKLWSFE